MEKVEPIIQYLQNELKLSDTDASIVRYGLESVVTFIVNFAFITAVAWLLGVLKLSLISAFAMAGLRILSGGAHSAKLVNCSLVGAVISPGIALMTKYVLPAESKMLLIVSLLTFIIAIINIWLYAPADTPSKPITKPEQKRKLRLFSFIYIFIWISVVVMNFTGIYSVPGIYLWIIALAILWQVFSITPKGYKFMEAVDYILPK